MPRGDIGTTGHDLRRLGEELGRLIGGLFEPQSPMQTATPDVPPVPESGLGLSALPTLWEQIVRASAKLGSPLMMGHMDTAPHPAAALTDGLVSALNNNLLFRELSPFASAVEEALCADLAGRLGLAEDAAGTFCSGGALANLTALFAACGGFEDPTGRERVRLFVPGCIHSSVTKAAAVLGIAPDQAIRVAGDAQGRADPDRLRHLLARHATDRCVVVGVLGSTVHGAVEDIDRLADVTEQTGAWLHVDAIYGGALAFSHQHRHFLAGLARADSVAVGPQKWMYVPRLSAIVYLKDPALFDRRLGAAMPYSQTGERHRGTWGLQGSRRADAVTLWALLQVLGARRLGEWVDATADSTRQFHAMLDEHPTMAPTHAPDLNLQCFGWRDAARDPEELRAAHRRLTEAGGPWVSLSQWDGALLLRAVILNAETGPDEFEALLGRF